MSGRWWKRQWGFAAAGIVLAAIAVGCGGDEPTPTAKATTSTNTTATATATAAASAKATSTAAATASPKVATTSTAASGGTTIRIADAGTLGKVLTDANGRTLYTFKNDTAGSGKSACNGGCAANWPAAAPSGTPTKPGDASGDLAVITRDDGSTQLAYKGLPLYRYTPDTAPGDTKGEGVGGVWTVARP